MSEPSDVLQGTLELLLLKILALEPMHGLAIAQRLRPVAIDVAAGVALAGAARQWIESLLFGVEPMDTITYLGSGAVLLLITAVASAIPARAAARVDPIQSPRSE